MSLDAFGKFQTIRQFLRDDLMRVIAHHDMDFVFTQIEVVEESLRIQRAAGSSNGDENFQSARTMATQ